MDKVLVFETSYGGSIPSKGTNKCASIAQLVEVEDHSFTIASIAQLVEQLPLKEMVPGSNPGGCTRKLDF